MSSAGRCLRSLVRTGEFPSFSAFIPDCALLMHYPVRRFLRSGYGYDLLWSTCSPKKQVSWILPARASTLPAGVGSSYPLVWAKLSPYHYDSVSLSGVFRTSTSGDPHTGQDFHPTLTNSNHVAVSREHKPWLFSKNHQDHTKQINRLGFSQFCLLIHFGTTRFYLDFTYYGPP